MDFESALLDLQSLTTDQQDGLRDALDAIESGESEKAIEVLRQALEAVHIDPNVGGGVDRDKIPASDFVDSSRRRFPISSPKDVQDAVSSFGRAKPPIPLESFKRRLISIAKRKGSAFVSRLPDSWEVKADELAINEAFAFAEGWVSGVEFGEVGKPIQIIKTGQFQHPQHGNITISKSDLEEMVKNFDNKIRGQEIPIDVDHKHELGAVGWFRSLKGPKEVDGEFAIFAVPEWNDKGKELVKGGAFKYFSPHFGVWKDPETKETFNNVLLSGAITNFPFLKGMQPLSFVEFKEGSVADENTAVKVEDFNTLKEAVAKIGETLAASALAEEKKSLTERASVTDLSDDKKKELVEAIKASKMSDDDKATLVKQVETPPKSDEGEKKELSEIRAEFTGREETLSKQLKEANDRILVIEKEKRTIKFLEIITGNNGSPAWVGTHDKHLKLMESLADSQGEDSEEYKSYVEMQTSHAKQIAESNLFGENGTSNQGPLTNDEDMTSGIKKLIEDSKGSDKVLTLAEATTEYLSTHQKEYKKADDAHLKRIAQAGG